MKECIFLVQVVHGELLMRNGIDATGSSFDIPQFPSTIEEPPNVEPPIWEACENHS